MDEKSQNNSTVVSDDLLQIIKKIEVYVLENRTHSSVENFSIKDFRRMFDQASSRMNQAILNDHPSEEIHKETLRTISTLIEILSRTK